MKQLCVVCSGPMGLFSEKFELCWCSEPEIKQDSLTQSNWLLDTAHSFRARKWAEQVEFGQSASNPWRWCTALPPMFEQSLWDLSRAAQLGNYFTYKISASFSARAAERRVCRLGMKVVCRACVDVVMKCNTSDQGRWRGRAENGEKRRIIYPQERREGCSREEKIWEIRDLMGQEEERKEQWRGESLKRKDKRTLWREGERRKVGEDESSGKDKKGRREEKNGHAGEEPWRKLRRWGYWREGRKGRKRRDKRGQDEWSDIWGGSEKNKWQRWIIHPDFQLLSLQPRLRDQQNVLV